MVRFVISKRTLEFKMPVNPAPSKLPDRTWGLISMDIISELPGTKTHLYLKTTLCDTLFRTVYFLPVNSTNTAIETAKNFSFLILSHLGISETIVLNRDARFI